MKKKNGFTLIELLAVIIILGILMIIAIPSVTSYIQNSRKSAYVDTAKEIASATRNKVNDGKLGMYDTNTTYYIPSSYIKTENSSKSPYGDFVYAFVGVIYNGKGYKYYWISVDDANQGVKNIVAVDKLNEDDIVSDIDKDDIKYTVEHIGIGDRQYIKILKEDGTWNDIYLDDTSGNVSESGGTGAEDPGNSGSNGGGTPPITVSNIVCKKATILHETDCNNGYCKYVDSIGNGARISYGTIVSGNPKAGDAYDCDVNSDGTYDNITERFYYLKSDGNKSLLIYYKNIGYDATYAYDSSNENWHGPITAYTALPDLTEWDHPSLIPPGTRQIVTETNSIYTPSTGASRKKIENFSYTNKAARLATYQEIQAACGNQTITTKKVLDNCNWLLENVPKYENGGSIAGYWLETPTSGIGRTVFHLRGDDRHVESYVQPINSNGFGIRPVITVLTDNISN